MRLTAQLRDSREDACHKTLVVLGRARLSGLMLLKSLVTSMRLVWDCVVEVVELGHKLKASWARVGARNPP